MYPVPDEDLELLEAYLDDALSDQELSALRGRLAVEPTLMAALRQLRDERSQRQAFFQSIDPTPAEVDDLVYDIRVAAQRKRWWQDHRKLTRWASAVAACLVMGIAGAFVLHAWDKSPLHPSNPDGPMATGTPSNLVSPARFAVEVTDDSGKVMAVQHFDDQNEANDFLRDLKQMQTRHRQTTNGMTIMDNDF